MNKLELAKWVTNFAKKQGAITATKYLSPDKYRVLPDPKYYPKDRKDLNLSDNNYDKLTTPEKIKIAKELEESAESQSDKIISASGDFSDSVYSLAKVLSNGFEGEEKSTYFSAFADVTVKD